MQQQEEALGEVEDDASGWDGDDQLVEFWEEMRTREGGAAEEEAKILLIVKRRNSAKISAARSGPKIRCTS